MWHDNRQVLNLELKDCVFSYFTRFPRQGESQVRGGGQKSKANECQSLRPHRNDGRWLKGQHEPILNAQDTSRKLSNGKM